MNSLLNGRLKRGHRGRTFCENAVSRLDIQRMIAHDHLQRLINDALDSAHAAHVPGKCYCKPLQIGRVPCGHCNGNGVVPLPGVGETLRALRLAQGVTLGQLIVHFTKSDHRSYSKAHVVNLEKGRDVFSLQLIEKYQKALQKVVRAAQA